MQAEALDGALDDTELSLLVLERLGDDEREVEVAVIVVDGTAAGLTPHQVAAVGLESLHIHLAKRVLVLPYHHRTPVLPKIQHHTVGLTLVVRSFVAFYKVVLYGDIPIRICLV